MMIANSILPQMLSASEVCERLSCSKPTLYRLIAQGDVPRPIKLGHRSVWSEADLAVAIAKLAKQPHADNPCIAKAQKAAEASAEVRAAKADVA